MSDIKVKIDILNDALDKKEKLLVSIYNITENQELFYKLEDEKQKDKLIKESSREKQIIIDEVISIDNIFINIVEEIKEELKYEKDLYQEKLNIMTEKIKKVTDLDIKIRVKEERNRRIFEFDKIKNSQIKTLKTSKSYIIKQYEKNNRKNFK